MCRWGRKGLKLYGWQTVAGGVVGGFFFFFFFGLLCIFKFSYDKHVSLDLQNVTVKMKFLKRRDVQDHRGDTQHGPIHENIKCVCCVSMCVL